MSEAEAETKLEEEKAALPVAGEILYCGGTDWDSLGRKGPPNAVNLASPTRLRPLVGVDIRFVASGCKIEPSPVACMVSEATNVVCGADFTVWLSSVEGSSILTAGLPQYGQLGHGTNNEYNSKDSSVKLVYEPQPRPRAIATLSGKTILKVACGTNHTDGGLVDMEGLINTCLFSVHADVRLGHREQKDEWAPRLVEVFQKQNVLPPNAIVSAGSVNSACTAGGGQLYMWGKLKITGDDWMYPKPVMDLSGWNIRCMDSGNMHHLVGAENSCISWGHAQYGELGYGPLGQKSSANPKKVDILEGMRVMSVACGMGLSLIVVDRTNGGDRLDQLEVYDGESSVEGTEENKNGDVAAVKRTPKKKDKSSAGSKKRKGDDSDSDSSESEDNDGEDSEDDEDLNGEAYGVKQKRGGRTSGRGRGRGRGANKMATTAKSSGRGRGRPKKRGGSSR
ncbi:hypothetical protein ZIOFF_003043 [Zingiber officinale]|uniref:Uncharacterized protein n=1 Tax=Zingiber officinale TaxID=94328 RepID=A0A8J5ICK4_ZINOF|nr:hypothetical protein ZIOFF_003043 [Zingiber officinale]